MKPDLQNSFRSAARADFSPHLHANAERIIQLLEQALPVSERPALEAHLASCAECRAFWRDARQLESNLERLATVRPLSEQFVENLWRRIESESALEKSRDPLQERARLIAEFTAHSERLKRQMLGPSRILDVVGYALAAGIVAYLVVAGSALLQSSAEALSQTIIPYREILVPTMIAIGLAAGALFFGARLGSPYEARSADH